MKFSILQTNEEIVICHAHRMHQEKRKRSYKMTETWHNWCGCGHLVHADFKVNEQEKQTVCSKCNSIVKVQRDNFKVKCLHNEH